LKSPRGHPRLSWFAAGLVAAAAAFFAALWLGGYTVTSRESLAQLKLRLATLEDENRELTDDLFRYGGLLEAPFADGDLPYDAAVDAAAVVAEARARAAREGRFLMVTFGANWCLDCRTLHRRLQSKDVLDYTRDLFHFVHVDVGKFNQNREVADALGVDLGRGIPVAIFFGPDGQLIGTTNEGQLEPARRYSSKQILLFVRDIVERARIVAPDSVGG
jgi:thioredoxin 1